MQKKTLILRLTSLGDLILASSVLEVAPFTLGRQLDWVVASNLSDVLLDHPKIHRIWSFDRTTGLRGWVALCRELWSQNYQEVFDLHRSLRTRIMQFLFLVWSLQTGSPIPRWKSVSKQRIRLFLYYLLKGFFPRKWHPTPWVTRYTKLMGGTGAERPNLRHLLQNKLPPQFQGQFSDKVGEKGLPKELVLQKGEPRKYICVMPSSRWMSKNWSVDHYLELLKKLPIFPVILGKNSDSNSIKLTQKLKNSGIPHFSVVGESSFAEAASLLGSAVFYLGGDTGFAHLAEALGTPAKIIFGPTTPEMGFGPWRKESQAISSSLWCRPCGKDGSYCFRLTQKFLCLKELSVNSVLTQIERKLE